MYLELNEECTSDLHVWEIRQKEANVKKCMLTCFSTLSEFSEEWENICKRPKKAVLKDRGLESTSIFT